MIVNVENPKELTKTKTGINSDYSKVARYKVKIQKTHAFHILAVNNWNL